MPLPTYPLLILILILTCTAISPSHPLPPCPSSTTLHRLPNPTRTQRTSLLHINNPSHLPSSNNPPSPPPPHSLPQLGILLWASLSAGLLLRLRQGSSIRVGGARRARIRVRIKLRVIGRSSRARGSLEDVTWRRLEMDYYEIPPQTRRRLTPNRDD